MRRAIRRFVLALVLVLVLLVAALVGFAYSGAVDVSATGSELAAVEWFLETVREQSIDARAGSVEVPPLDEPGMRETGLVHFHEMCVTCHGAPGLPPSEIGRGLNPEPPDLTREVHSPQVNYWIVANGIRMTGMPAFSPTHGEEELWAITAFLEELPGLSAEEYARRVREAGLELHSGGHAHDGPGGGHSHGDDGHGGQGATSAGQAAGVAGKTDAPSGDQAAHQAGQANSGHKH